MRVAILNHDPMPHGGDQVLVGCLIGALRKIGVDVEHVWGGGLAGKLAGFDLVHVFHINCCHCRINFDAVQVAGLPYVVTPIFFPEIHEASREEQATWLGGSRAVMPFSLAEQTEVVAEIEPHCNFQVIPSGTDPMFHAAPSSDRVGVCASDWNSTKNTRIIEQVCQELGLPFEWFRGQIPDVHLPMVYRRYKLFATATTSDRMSLAVGEALCSGCRVIASTANRGNEWYPGLVTIDPVTPYGMWREVISASYHAEEWDWRPNDAARQLTWAGMAKQVARVYRWVIQ